MIMNREILRCFIRPECNSPENKYTMRKFFASTLVILAGVLSFIAAGEKYRELPREYSGTMMPYSFSDSDTVPVWPDSLKAVYVAHVARHGARYISSPKKVKKIDKALYKAAVEGNITPAGREFLSLIVDVIKVSRGQWGLLSEVGRNEESRLARELYAIVPELMRDADVSSISTYVPRVVMTMYEFNHELSRLTSDIRMTAAEGRQFSPIVRCFTADTLYADYRQDGDWVEVYESFVNKYVPYSPAQRMLGRNHGYDKRKLRELTMEIYGIMQSLTAFGLPAPTDRYMTVEEYYRCWQASNLSHYLRNTITPLSTRAGTATSLLLQTIINDAGNALAANEDYELKKQADMAVEDFRPKLNFYFGHAETLMPLLSLMQVPGCFDMSADYLNLDSKWRDYDIVPLGANIQLFILRGPTGRYYAALRHNGRFIEPLEGSGRIVDWNTLRNFYEDRISRF